MNFEEKWQKTLEETRILRFFKHPLSFQEVTVLPYIFLGPSVMNLGDTVVRKGKVEVDKPFIFLPKNIPQFMGFNLEEELGADENLLRLFFMVRGINFPSLKYKHEISTVDVCEQEPEKALESYKRELERQEDLITGLVYGPTECWQLSVLFYVSLLISRSAPRDFEKYYKSMFDFS